MTMTLLLLTGFCAWALTGLIRRMALRADMLDIPGPRSSHHHPVPRGGGLAVVVVFLAASGWLNNRQLLPAEALHAMLWGGGLIALVGLIDDYRGLPALARLLVHLAASNASLAIAGLLDQSLWPLPIWLVAPALTIGLAWGINLYNFMDGIDSLAAGEAIFISLGAAAILWMGQGNPGEIAWLLLLATATLGFLVWNLPPARIFMGDTCSGFLGFSLGILALITSRHGAITLWSWLILGALFLCDATLTLLARMHRREQLHTAHRGHAYQILARRFNSHAKVSLLALAVNCLWLLPLAALATMRPALGPACFAVAALPLAWVVFSLNRRRAS
ncbi:MAG: MraY family glycosyltransferase [Thermodesulfobacteriota bacterium]